MPFLIASILMAVLFYWLWRRGEASSADKGLSLPKRKLCHWHRAEQADRGRLLAFDCEGCGFRAYSATGKPPTECKKQFSGKR